MPEKIPDPIEEILGPKGRLSESLPEFECRPSQINMAGLILNAIEEKAPAIIEAGTGTGKTLGYLLPLILSNKKSVISTGTKNLQEQVYFKDIPILSKATGSNINALLMKGRKNYLCLHRFQQFFLNPTFFNHDHQEIKKLLDKWMLKTTYADRAELEWMGDDDTLWDSLSSTSEQCLGTDCMHWDDCYLNNLRRDALLADMIIVNHYLFFADLMVKKQGYGEIIPRFQVVVFDEAHKIEEIATNYMGESLSSNQLLELANDLEKELKEFPKTKKGKTKKQILKLKTGVDKLQDIFGELDIKDLISEGVLGLIQSGPAVLINESLEAIHKSKEVSDEENPLLRACAVRAGNLKQTFDHILSSQLSGWLKWYEKRKRSLVLHTSPLDISENMQEFLYEKVKTTIFTSATLSTEGHFDYFKKRLGLPDDMKQGIFPSHFNFKEQSLMYVPLDLPRPNDQAFGMKIAERITEVLKITSGRALVLFTSYQNLNIVYQIIEGNIPYTVFKQGDAPRSILLDRFKEETSSVLLATGSFWQGVDVPGESLSALIIDKLPFESPGEPVVAGRIESIRSQKGNPFMEYQLPAAVITLKQGLGRLIRKSMDRGLITVMDSRLIKSRYGKFFFRSLPEIPLTHKMEDAVEFFNGNGEILLK